MDFSFFNKLIVFLIDIIAVWIGVLVCSSKPRKKINWIFILMVILMLFWVNFAFFARLVGAANFSLSSLFLKIAWFVTPLFFVFLYFLVVYLIEQEKKYRVLSVFVSVFGITATLVTGFSNLVIDDLIFINGDLTIAYGKGMFPFLGIIFFLICTTLYPLIRTYLKSSSEEKKEKLEYLLIGIFIFYLGNFIFNIFFPIFLGISRLYYFGDYSAIFLIGLTGYAITKKQLFGIRVILTQLLVGAIAILLLWQAVVVIPNWFEFSWKIILFLLFLVFGYLLFRSVREEIKRRAELQQLYLKVDKLSKAKSDFISIASHQLRTPVSVIKGIVSMIKEGDFEKLAKEKKERFINNLWQKSCKLEDIINDILNATEMTAAKYDVSKDQARMINLVKLIKNIIDDFAEGAEERGIKIYLKADSQKTPKIYGEIKYLREAFGNIIDNAIKYTPSIKKNHESRDVREEKGIIRINIAKQDNNVIISVKDNGIGIPKEEIPKLFKKFSRASNARDMYTDGSGLGLFTVKEIIEGHGGKVWLNSELNKGSTFYISLPIQTDKKADVKGYILKR